MNTIIENKINEIYSNVMSKPNQILEIFNNFFGEDKVDMQGIPSIEVFRDWLMNKVQLNWIIPRSSSIYNKDFEYLTYRCSFLSSISEEKCIEILNTVNISLIIDTINNEDTLKEIFILVHFPHVRVTNEYDKFVDINNLYAKVNILYDGTLNGGFGLNRSEYSYLHIRNNYMHSHISGIPFRNFESFQTPCTGSGPINGTISNLNNEFSPDIWELFCLELSKYVEVESIEGVPYHKLENLTHSNSQLCSSKFEVVNSLPYYPRISNIKGIIEEFTIYFINQKKLKFSYVNNSFSVGMSFTDYIVTISNCFIGWYNEQFNNHVYTYTLNQLITSYLIKECVIANNKIYTSSASQDMEYYRVHIGKKVCTFKGEDVLLNITDIKNIDNSNISNILDPYASLYILSKILRVINYRYGKSEQTDSEGHRISEKVRYV